MLRKRQAAVSSRRVIFPDFDNRVAIVLQEGPEQSYVRFLDDRSKEYLPREGCYPNTCFRNELRRRPK